MTKCKFLSLVMVLFIIVGWLHPAQASTLASTCSSMLVSTPLCDELISQACIDTNKEVDTPQIQSSIIITSPSGPEALRAGGQTQPETLSIPSSTPSEPTTQQVANLDSDKIFDLINQYRASLGLAPFEREASVCELAEVRSTELALELSNGTIHSGLYNRDLAFWIWENAKVGSNEEGTVAWWISSSIHHQSIVGDYKYSCVKCQGTNCTQLFTSFTPK